MMHILIYPTKGTHYSNKVWKSCAIWMGSLINLFLNYRVANRFKNFHFFKTLKQNLLKLSKKKQAVLACILAISLQKMFPSPIFLLDEIDAALDQMNCEKLGKLVSGLGSKSVIAKGPKEPASGLQEQETQVLIISHKKEMQKYAQQLLGVYVTVVDEKGSQTSKTVSKEFEIGISRPDECFRTPNNV